MALSVNLLSISHAVSILNVQGNNFVDSLTGNRFNIIGAALVSKPFLNLHIINTKIDIR